MCIFVSGSSSTHLWIYAISKSLNQASRRRGRKRTMTRRFIEKTRSGGSGQLTRRERKGEEGRGRGKIQSCWQSNAEGVHATGRARHPVGWFGWCHLDGANASMVMHHPRPTRLASPLCTFATSPYRILHLPTGPAVRVSPKPRPRKRLAVITRLMLPLQSDRVVDILSAHALSHPAC